MSLAFELPQRPSIDDHRAGIVRVALPILGSLLKLPEQEVRGARVTRDGTLELLLVGPGLPRRPAADEAEHVSLMCRQDTRQNKAGQTELRTSMWLSSDPAHPWVMEDWHVSPHEEGYP